MLLYRINQEANLKENDTSGMNHPMLSHEELDELLKQLEEEAKGKEKLM